MRGDGGHDPKSPRLTATFLLSLRKTKSPLGELLRGINSPL
jgi:hypothetical protein